MRYICGIQPTGELHLGNYFGAIKQQLDIQDSDNTLLFFIADYHALTNGNVTPSELRQNCFDIAVNLLALGVDPDRSILFRQSEIEGDPHPALALILSNYIGTGVLQRCHAYMTKVEQGITPNVGLFYYPILMAADILLYDINKVLVGGDQNQHIELTADLGRAFNSRFGDVMKIPEAQYAKVPKVPGVDGNKMGKSNNNTIPLLGNIKVVRKKIMSIKTDSTDFKSEPLPYKNCTVFQLYSLMASEKECEVLIDLYQNDRNFGYGHAKQMLFEKYKDYFAEAYERKEEILSNRTSLRVFLAEGASKASNYAIGKLNQVKRAVGLKDDIS